MSASFANPFKALFKMTRVLLSAVAGGLLVLIIGAVIHLERRPDLKVWHTAELDAEFTADSPVRTFEEYLDLEDVLFERLWKRVYARIEREDQRPINRYHPGSPADPARWTPNWNRSYQLPSDNPRCGVLLLHGMSDSPYSLRGLGQRLHAAGAWVVGLRLPGHGTAPGELVSVHWRDMAAAVKLAAVHLQARTGNLPLYILGYSNGGTLAVDYALRTARDSDFPGVRGLILISPALGVTPLAALAVWQARIGHLIGLEKLAWNSILPEYDPFKYQSFPVNAGDQVYRLTADLQKRLRNAAANQPDGDFPRVLAFQSVADATVSTRAVVEGLFSQLPAGDHELVLFDFNRHRDIDRLLLARRLVGAPELLQGPPRSFTISFVTNAAAHDPLVVVRRKRRNQDDIQTMPLDLHWPAGVYSLSHVALPFSPDDPLYGVSGGTENPGLRLGNIGLRGEKGVLQVPAADMLRLRWNPFYPFVEQRIVDFMSGPQQP